MAKPYNGHRSWNAWNVALWVANGEAPYRLTKECLSRNNLDLATSCRFRNLDSSVPMM
jgi:hypothetical protein